jgi:hypothetical protein
MRCKIGKLLNPNLTSMTVRVVSHILMLKNEPWETTRKVVKR